MMRSSSTDTSSTDTLRAELLQRYQRNRARTRDIFGLLSDAAYYQQPIALRHPIVFYEGHLPGFSFNTLVKHALGGSSVDAQLERLFARGIDPEESSGEASSGRAVREWPSRREVRAFVDEVDRRVVDAVTHADIDQTGHPLLDRAEAVFAILEHEEMHQETLLYMFHRLPYAQKIAPATYRPRTEGAVTTAEWIEVPAGRATLGVDRGVLAFAWDNECPAASASVPAFSIERHDVTNAQFMAFVEAGGYQDPQWWTAEDWEWLRSDHRQHPGFWEADGHDWFWRGMFSRIPLPLSWPVFVSLAEASAFARWRGVRLPTEAEFQRAAYGSPAGERAHPWGDHDPDSSSGAFDFSSFDPVPAGSFPAGASAWGVQDLVGNGWEWTETAFAPFPGFRAIPSYPEYSADFFDGQHFVMKGASMATARELLRPTFRNWFRRRYPYMYATFHCVKSN
jgi:gamma-glutamyl hercynylcysteine S-oxide synthase